MKDQNMLYLRVLGTFNLLLTLYRLCTFQWSHGTTHDTVLFHPNHCPPTDGTSIVFILKVLCLLYNTRRSFKILWGIRSFFTLALFIKRLRSSATSCYGFWFISTLAELCIKVYLVQNGYLDPPGFLQLIIELVMVYLLTNLLATNTKTKANRSRNMFFSMRKFSSCCCCLCSGSGYLKLDVHDDHHNLQELV